MSASQLPPYIGSGLSFPMQVDANGNIALVSGVEDVEKSIRVVLSTAPGERPMRPQFGCRIWELLFEPINDNTMGLMEGAVEEALSRWEPRIEVTDVVVDPTDQATGSVLITIAYRLRDSNDERNLVHPFYLIPGEGGEGEESP